MPRFFVDNINDDFIFLDEESSLHIGRSLRMKKGNELILCDAKGFDYKCTIESFGEKVCCKVISREKCIAEPSVHITLYQAVPKMDKLETIVQKSVELGVTEIVPVLTSRCVSRPDNKTMDKKISRLSKISLEAAKQSGRGIIPQISHMVTFKEAVDRMKGDDFGILLYEGGGKRLNDFEFSENSHISIFVGAEGGFDLSEVLYAESMGISRAGLGPRILRCETAPLATLAIILNITKNM